MNSPSTIVTHFFPNVKLNFRHFYNAKQAFQQPTTIYFLKNGDIVDVVFMVTNE